MHNNINTSLKKERILWIDIYRVLAILIIIAGHANCWETLISCIGLACVQPFFLISILLLKSKDFRSTTKRAFRLSLPIIFWTVIYAVLCVILNPELTNKGIESVLYLPCYAIFRYGFHLWFMIALFLFILLYPLANRLPIFVNCCLIILCASYALTNYYLFIEFEQFRIQLSLYILSCATFLFSIIVAKHNNIKTMNQHLQKHVNTYLIACISGVALSFILQATFPAAAFYPHALCSMVILIPISVFIEQKAKALARLIAKFGPTVFLAYGVHMVFIQILIKLQFFLNFKIMINPNSSSYSLALLGLNTILFLLPFIILIGSYYTYHKIKNNKFAKLFILLQ